MAAILASGRARCAMALLIAAATLGYAGAGWTQAGLPASASPVEGNIVFDGDSVSKGQEASPGKTPDAQLRTMLAQPVVITDVAVSGLPVFATLERYGRVVQPLYNRAARYNVIAFHAGDNDLAAGKTAAETYAKFSRYVSLAHAQGWKIIVSTELQRTLWAPEQQAELWHYNRLLLANTSGADAVVDYAAAPGLRDPDQRRNPAYFASDGVHPSDNGYRVLARMIRTALDQLAIADR